LEQARKKDFHKFTGINKGKETLPRVPSFNEREMNQHDTMEMTDKTRFAGSEMRTVPKKKEKAEDTHNLKVARKTWSTTEVQTHYQSKHATEKEITYLLISQEYL
jgi:hypothetical protein